MMMRLFNLLFTAAGIWLAVVFIKFADMAVVLTAPIVLVLMFAPLAIVACLCYLFRPQAD